MYVGQRLLEDHANKQYDSSSTQENKYEGITLLEINPRMMYLYQSRRQPFRIVESLLNSENPRGYLGSIYCILLGVWLLVVCERQSLDFKDSKIIGNPLIPC